LELTLRFILAAILSYLLGNLNFSIIFTRLFYNRDIRKYGSGNAGTTNTMRIFGFLSGALVLLFDLAKGACAVLLAKALLPEEIPILVGLLAGFLAAIGHVYPALFRFRGGKGVATIMGALLALDWRIFACTAAILFSVLLFSGYMSLSSMVAACSIPVILFLFQLLLYKCTFAFSLLTFLLALPFGGLVLFTHRSNIKRLRAGTESKFSIGFHDRSDSK
jgi:glycerol-3-phosphate acyltransferase PlsY